MLFFFFCDAFIIISALIVSKSMVSVHRPLSCCLSCFPPSVLPAVPDFLRGATVKLLPAVLSAPLKRTVTSKLPVFYG
jgi:hypothetical protein